MNIRIKRNAILTQHVDKPIAHDVLDYRPK